MKFTCLVFDAKYDMVLNIGTIVYHPNCGMVKSAFVYNGHWWLHVDQDGNARATECDGTVHHSWTFKTLSVMVIESERDFYEMKLDEIVPLLKTAPLKVWDAMQTSDNGVPVVDNLRGIDSKTIQLNFLRNIERELLSHGGKNVARNKWVKSLNWVKVKNYLMNGSSHSGKNSAIEQCVFLGIDPDGHRIDQN